jgi:hypothetical protein
MNVRPEKHSAITAEHDTAFNTTAQVTKSADASQFHALEWLSFNYAATPGSGDEAVININSVEVFGVDVKDTAMTFMRFPKPVVGARNQEHQASLITGGAIGNHRANAGYR